MDCLAPFKAMVGYLNFSDGSPSSAFQTAVNEFFQSADAIKSCEPNSDWRNLHRELLVHTDPAGPLASAFGDLSQARQAVSLTFDVVLPAYREHHRDLLFHHDDNDLFLPLFLVRAFEATLAERHREDPADAARNVLLRLNDFIGHRPVAVLENDRRCDPYERERVRPVPLFIAGIGVGRGRFEPMVGGAMKILLEADPDLLQQASLDPRQIEELAVDPRAYDFSHPVHQRPSYQFGEWDPHHFDKSGRYDRFIVRWMNLEALCSWLKQAREKGIPDDEACFEASAALAGTMLLAAGVSGGSPSAHSSDITLANLVPGIAQCRDEFYRRVMKGLKGSLKDRLKADAERTGQPFGGIRRYLNHHLAKLRAAQLQADHLSQIFASMGYGDAAREQARIIPTPATRLRCEIVNQFTLANRCLDHGKIAEAAQALVAAQDLMHRGIACGAMVDPWNILGFQGNFSLFGSLENSIQDPRVDRLLQTMQQMFSLYDRLLREAALAGDVSHEKQMTSELKKLARWWDKFATTTVSDLRSVSGEASAESATFVAKAMKEYRQSGAAAGDVKFWNQYAADFSTPQACASVVEALLHKSDLVAAMALLMHWLSQCESVPLEDSGHSFHQLAERWMTQATGRIRRAVAANDAKATTDAFGLVEKFLARMEVNADELWDAPPVASIFPDRALMIRDPEDSDDGLYSAAYEDFSFKDSADDGNEGSTIDAEGPRGMPNEDAISSVAEQLERRLRFLENVSRLLQAVAALPHPQEPMQTTWRARLADWAGHAAMVRAQLGQIGEAIQSFDIPAPSGAHDAIVDYDRKQAEKEEALTSVIDATMEVSHAMVALRAAIAGKSEIVDVEGVEFPWERLIVDLLAALWDGSTVRARAVLPELLDAMNSVSLLYVPINQGGEPAAVFQARYARDSLRKIVGEMPRLGLFRETFHVLKRAIEIEQRSHGDRRRVTEFNLLFPVGYRAVVENLVHALGEWESTRNNDQRTMKTVGLIVERFSKLWVDHISNVRLSELERSVDWEGVVEFVKKYGRDLFTQKFLAFGNIRGILHQGVGEFLDALDKEPESSIGRKLLENLGKKIGRADATEKLDFILRAVIENYDAYRDYNSITTQSDYGDNLHILLEFLRVGAGYDRHRWALEPAALAHAVLARRGRLQAAALLQKTVVDETKPIAEFYQRELEGLQRKFALSLPTVADRIAEQFVKSFEFDRLLALVPKALEDSRNGVSSVVFDQLQEGVRQLSAETPGSGFEAPAWVRKLEAEVQSAVEKLDRPEGDIEPSEPRIALKQEDFKAQLEIWHQSLSGGGDEDSLG